MPAEIEAKTLDVGGTVGTPANPEKNGYDFAGWKNGDALFDFSTPITTNITLKAEWTLHNYTITYKNVTEHENPDTYTIEDEIILKDPTKGTDAEKTIFVQWHSEETLQKPIEKIGKGTTGNKIFYAEWSDKNVFTVTFDTDGGSEVDSQRVKDGEKATKPAKDPTKEGYTFKGWDFDFEKPITESTTVRAKWEINKYTVTFMNGKEKVGDSIEVEYGSTIPEKDFPAAPTKEGYGDFLGWYNGTSKFDSTTPIKGDTILNATFGISVTKNTDGSYSFADGTYKAVWEGDNAIIRFKLPEEVTFAKYDKLRLKGTFSFGDTAQYKQFSIRKVEGEPLFGYNMITDWKNGLSGEKSEPVLGLLSNNIKASDCKFVTGEYLDGVTKGETEISITIKDVTLSYDKYDASVGVVLFDPAKDWTGETTEIDGETYANIKALSWSTPSMTLPNYDCNDFSKLSLKASVKDAKENYQIMMKFVGDNDKYQWVDIAAINWWYGTNVPREESVEPDLSELDTTKFNKIILHVQEKVTDEVSEKVENAIVHLGKIIATVK